MHNFGLLRFGMDITMVTSLEIHLEFKAACLRTAPVKNLQRSTPNFLACSVKFLTCLTRSFGRGLKASVTIKNAFPYCDVLIYNQLHGEYRPDLSKLPKQIQNKLLFAKFITRCYHRDLRI
ncbi:hypothetical protein L917_14214 [Phytophthora nicotianae]|uniref:Uncharacterized protein n=1 Tax=Phytophthora nicotianae TaxID=4792 RepID=W2KME5_PHYNI|nr:hypothetical protein L917_14214 [Phytophthora nicotianae]